MRFCGFAGFRWGKKQPGAAGGGRGSGNRPGISRLQNFLDENDQDCVFCEDLALPGLFACLPCAIWGFTPLWEACDLPRANRGPIPKRGALWGPIGPYATLRECAKRNLRLFPHAALVACS